jgi:hypothetical protein
MSSSGKNNENLNQTPVHVAYQFTTCSEYIKNMKVPTFSPKCIFCSCTDTISLNHEGSFRQCRNCNKQFKAVFDRRN